MTREIGKNLVTAAALVALVTLGGCAGFKRAVGAERTTPDEFRVVTKAPLVIPPEFNLRPPRPGEARPLELRPDLQARNALFGVQTGTQASAGEVALITQMGAQNADPRIRGVLDEEAQNVTHKPLSFADRIISFGGPAAANPAPVDAAAEAERQRAINNATGGGTATIQQNRPRGFKLPGL
ncbi:MAG: hypothetical protein FD163_1547 [Hyphomonadaceae bacterium]|nr:MAG: hypothetical protein FD128_763 [Hyphomonadaceae bacterium]KAF0184850.1 MAG: hypothetical protein FD163_1547 [Hyphomonadaceae bacterium]